MDAAGSLPRWQMVMARHRLGPRQGPKEAVAMLYRDGSWMSPILHSARAWLSQPRPPEENPANLHAACVFPSLPDASQKLSGRVFTTPPYSSLTHPTSGVTPGGSPSGYTVPGGEVHRDARSNTHTSIQRGLQYPLHWCRSVPHFLAGGGTQARSRQADREVGLPAT
jgi:hypothetical protein